MSGIDVWCIIVTVGCVVATVMQRRVYHSVLYQKGTSQYGKTAECIKGEFFYIVPEKEYNELTLLKLKEDRVGGKHES